MKSSKLKFWRYQFKFWHYGLLITLAIGSMAAYNLELSDKSLFITGEASHGHHQIELACSSCHGDGFSGPDAMQKACLNCHADELAVADSHPRKKFLDPRNASLLTSLDARQCVTCHTEHKPEITREMGVTLASDFCFHCHSDIAEDRPSHEGFGFDSCASAGCHNYHDNSSLYEDFLIAHSNEPDLLKEARLPARTAVQTWLRENSQKPPLTLQQADLNSTDINIADHTIDQAWAASAHAQVAVNCSDCHTDGQLQFSSREIVEQCGSCHSEQREGFTRGKHGMRLSTELPRDFTGAMSPEMARQPMRADAGGELSCASCHQPHETDLRFAAVDACLGCHNDEHSLAFKDSAHFNNWSVRVDSGPSCASCHLPRENHPDGKGGERVLVNHNQNHNLRPNDKMLPVCLNCHGAEFSLAALADEDLIENNFSGKPAGEHKTFDLIHERIARMKKTE